MSDVQSRPSASRGRGSGRVGRGGHSTRGARSTTRQSNGNASADAASSIPLDEQGELGQLKMQYASQLDTLKELFPEWTDNDLVLAVQESDGDLQTTIEAITEGKVSRFEDVVTHKTKEKSRSKSKDPSLAAAELATTATRGRGRGSSDSTRGARARGDRGRASRARGARGVSSSASNGAAPATAVASIETPSWGDSAPTEDAGWGDVTTTADNGGQWGSIIASDATPATASEGQKSSLIPEGTKKSWASMLAQPKVQPKPAIPAPAPVETVTHREIPAIQEPAAPLESATDTLPAPPLAAPLLQETQPSIGSSSASLDFGMPSEGSIELAPSKDRLTETNLENLPDTSIPPATDTTLSTGDPRSATASADPYGTPQHQTSSRPPMGGYATNAWKATAMPGRSASYQRRILEQREAVVMPGNHAVDRAAVQFGQMGLNGDNKPADVDDDREEPETRAQPPQQSPTTQPRASLPPAPQPAIPTEQHSVQEPIPAPRPAPGLPPQQPAAHMPHVHQGMGQQNAYGPSYSQNYGRYGGGSFGQQEPPVSMQKQYDAFSQQLNYPGGSQPDVHSAPSQIPGSMPQQSQYSQTAADYSSQYGAEQQRYQNYYGSSYGQQGASSQQDQNIPPQRSASGFGGDAAGGASQGAQGGSRFGETTSGHTTPSQPIPGSQQQPPHTQSMQHPQSHTQTGHAGSYQYGQPYYNSSYYNSYMNQYPGYNYNQQGYSHAYGKGGMYNQPHHGYGISPQAGYEHSASPANTANAFGSSSLGRDSGFPSSLGDYNRSGSAQAQHSSAGFPGSMGSSDAFTRSAAGFSGQGNQYGGQPQVSAAGTEDSLKAFPDSKGGPNNPSSIGGLPGRTGSANQSGFPQPQGGFGGYPSHLSQQLHGSSPYSGLGGLGHQGGVSGQQSQQGGYGGYGGAAGFGNQYGSYGRGGWGGSYGH